MRNDLSDVTNLAQLLKFRAEQHPDKTIFTFLDEQGKTESTLNYEEFDKRAKCIAAMLQQRVNKNDRVLLIYPPGIDYICAFFGCLYAGVIAVPVYPPLNKRLVEKLQSIINNAQPAAILSTHDIVKKIRQLKRVKQLSQAPFVKHFVEKFVGAAELTEWSFDQFVWLTTDTLDESLVEEYQPNLIRADQLAFLQYTSGSTGDPKGVMVSHENLMDNQQLIQQFYGVGENLEAVCWVPPYHDMGLIGSVMQPIYSDGHATLMSPMTFLKDPYIWLDAISKTKANATCGPDFSYRLCVKRITEEQKASLDLSSWNIAITGAEPIHVDTIKEFSQYFSSCGFKQDAFVPSYGLAEATLMVSLKKSIDMKPFDAKALQKNLIEKGDSNNGAHWLVSHGSSAQEVKIVNSDTLQVCPEKTVGEIWVTGASVCQGYWDAPDKTQETFQATLADDKGKTYLRTGDLGFVDEGELFITGRIKDLIIVRGANHYPQDIENTVAMCDDSVRMGCVAAFSVTKESEERLVIVAELASEFSKEHLNKVADTMSRSVMSEHQLGVWQVVLIKAKTLNKTTSGKVQRHASKQDFQNGMLDVVYLAEFDMMQLPELGADMADNDNPVDEPWHDIEFVKSSIKNQLRYLLDLDNTTSLDDHLSFFELGLDSLMAVELENFLQSTLSGKATLNSGEILECTDIERLAQYIVEKVNKGP